MTNNDGLLELDLEIAENIAVKALNVYHYRSDQSWLGVSLLSLINDPNFKTFNSDWRF